ncbi:MAG: hypothetical protein CL930_10315 [Deltaproteobacteria bacterium]|nr:hypothetical protein [Deltaproteobacteria bacterium]
MGAAKQSAELWGDGIAVHQHHQTPGVWIGTAQAPMPAQSQKEARRIGLIQTMRMGANGASY